MGQLVAHGRRNRVVRDVGVYVRLERKGEEHPGDVAARQRPRKENRLRRAVTGAQKGIVRLEGVERLLRRPGGLRKVRVQLHHRARVGFQAGPLPVGVAGEGPAQGGQLGFGRGLHFQPARPGERIAGIVDAACEGEQEEHDPRKARNIQQKSAGRGGPAPFSAHHPDREAERKKDRRRQKSADRGLRDGKRGEGRQAVHGARKHRVGAAGGIPFRKAGVGPRQSRQCERRGVQGQQPQPSRLFVLFQRGSPLFDCFLYYTIRTETDRGRAPVFSLESCRTDRNMV